MCPPVVKVGVPASLASQMVMAGGSTVKNGMTTSKIFSASISGVCSVAGRVGVKRFLEVLPWSCGLFPIEPIARNAERKDVGKPK